MSKLKYLLLGVGNIGAGIAMMGFVAFFLYRKGQQMSLRKLFFFAVGGVFLSFILMQFMPFVFPKLQVNNPEVTYAVLWDSPETEALWNRACNDCHSNESIWPWYSYVAPVSWLITRDVYEGRDELNISERDGLDETHEITEEIEKGSMPMDIYVIMHPEANLSDAETAQLITGLRATFGGGESREHGDDD